MNIFNWRSPVYKIILGGLIAMACLFWVFHGISFSALAGQIKQTSISLVILGVFVDISAYFWQALRWNVLLKAIKPVSYRSTLRSLYTGVFLNIFVPLRFGELARVYVATRSMAQVPYAQGLATLGVEYAMDGFWLAVALGAALCFVPLPEHLRFSALIFGTILLIGLTAAFIFVRFSRGLSNPVLPVGRLAFVNHLKIGLSNALMVLRTICATPQSLFALLISGLVLASRIAAFIIIMRACHIPLGIGAAAAVLLIKYVGLIIPNAPSNIGGYQFFIVYGLMLFGIEKTAAAGFAMVIFTVLLIAQAALGSIAFASSGYSFTQIRMGIPEKR